jgi:transposase
MKRALSLQLNIDERSRLQLWTRSRLAQVRLAERARIILLAADGLSDKAIAAREGCDRRTVARWRKRFIECGLGGIQRDAPRRSRKRLIPAELIETVIHKTNWELPPNGRRWSSRAMALAVGMSEASIRRIWHAQGIVPEHTVNYARAGESGRAQAHVKRNRAADARGISTTLLDAMSQHNEPQWSDDVRHEIC